MNTIRHDVADKTRARNNELRKKEVGFDEARDRQKTLRWKQKQFLEVAKRIAKSFEYSFLQFLTRFSLSLFFSVKTEMYTLSSFYTTKYKSILPIQYLLD